MKDTPTKAKESTSPSGLVGATKHKECESQKTSVLTVVATSAIAPTVTNTHRCVRSVGTMEKCVA